MTDAACRAANAREAVYKLSDGGGLYPLVKPSGTRLWNRAYRFSGKQKKLSHGVYPSVTLAEARRLRDEAKKLFASGVDPGANNKTAKLIAVISARNTFGGIAEEYLQRIEDEGAAAITKNRWLLIDIAGPELGTRPIVDITPAEILILLQRNRTQRTRGQDAVQRLREWQTAPGAPKPGAIAFMPPFASCRPGAGPRTPWRARARPRRRPAVETPT